MEDEKGKKITEGKRKWHAMPLIMLEPLADVFQAGKGHYGLHNILKEFDNPDEDFYDSTMRHLAACQINPLEIDPQDGCYHLAKVAFGALARLHHCLNKERWSQEEIAEKIEQYNALAKTPIPKECFFRDEESDRMLRMMGIVEKHGR